MSTDIKTYKLDAAKADGPAVPDGREPTRDELWELWLRLNNELPDRPAAVAEFWEHAQIDARARAAELLERQATACAICERERLHQSTRAADLEVERQAAPVPVPVNERLPEPEDCDAEGRCWWFCFECPGEHSYWILAKEVYCNPTYWLPAHALPLPEVDE